MTKEEQDLIINLVTKRLETTMIGCLARFESTFGDLWGYNQDYDKPLNDNQEKFLDSWEYTRTSILNHGNNQIRGVIEDIRKVSQNRPNQRYNYKFYFNNKNRKYDAE